MRPYLLCEGGIAVAGGSKMSIIDRNLRCWSLRGFGQTTYVLVQPGSYACVSCFFFCLPTAVVVDFQFLRKLSGERCSVPETTRLKANKKTTAVIPSCLCVATKIRRTAFSSLCNSTISTQGVQRRGLVVHTIYCLQRKRTAIVQRKTVPDCCF